MEQVLAKFHSLADPVLGSQQATTVADMITGLHELSDVREMTRLLVPHISAKKKQKQDERV
jgi:hypothetical protein